MGNGKDSVMTIDEVLTVTEEYDGLRLDLYLVQEMECYSRSFFQNLIKEGSVTINGKPIKPNYKVSSGDEVEIRLPVPTEMTLEPENIELDIVYQDDDIVVVNKPQGMVVHPAPGNYTGTLVNALLYHVKTLSGINEDTRPGIVHRIDKDTSGLLVVAKNDRSHVELAKQLKEKKVLRQYYALVINNINSDNGTVDAPIGRHPVNRKKMAVVSSGRNAVTHYKVIERFGQYTLIEAQLETGRTHQIRVHMAHIGHPVVGDPVYGPAKQKFTLNGQTLHARRLGLVHPSTGQYMEFQAPIPEYFEKLLKILRNKSK